MSPWPTRAGYSDSSRSPWWCPPPGTLCHHNPRHSYNPRYPEYPHGYNRAGSFYQLSTKNEKHSENADTSKFVIFDLDMGPWHNVKVKKAIVIRWHLSYCNMVPGMTSMGVMIFEISCRYQVVGSIEFKIWTIVWRKIVNDVTTCDVIAHSNLMKFQTQIYQGHV